VVNLLVARRRLYLRCHRYIDRLSGLLPKPIVGLDHPTTAPTSEC
jgi:hypothetical protein